MKTASAQSVMPMKNRNWWKAYIKLQTQAISTGLWNMSMLEMETKQPMRYW